MAVRAGAIGDGSGGLPPEVYQPGRAAQKEQRVMKFRRFRPVFDG
jgi:hypothetical protein